MEIKVLEAKLQVSQTSKKEYTNIKTESGFINVWGDHLAEKGKTLNITEPEIFGKSKWAKIDKASPTKKSEEKHDGITKQDYFNFLDAVWDHVAKLEPEPEAFDARSALVNTAMIAFSNGKIILETNEPPDEPPREG